MLEVNALADTLREQRLGALEASALLRTVMAEIDVAVFAFDRERRLRLVNRAGERLLGAARRAAARPRRRRARPARLPRARALPHHRRRHVPRRRRPLGGAPHDVPAGRPAARAAGARRRQPAAARRGAPGVAAADPRARPRAQQLARADQVDRRQPRTPARARAASRRTGRATCAAASPSSASRADSLSRFTAAYARLARLPAPTLQPVSTRRAGARASPASRRRCRSPCTPGPSVTLQADPDQLEQLLINLVRNAVDAALETGGGVTIGWERADDAVRVCRRRRGAGPAEHVEPVRAVLHDQARRLGHRPRAEPPDRRSARRHADAREPHDRPGLPRHPDAAAGLNTRSAG